MNETKDLISFEDFKRVELKVGRIINAESLTGYNKILKITVDLGNERRMIVSGLAKHYLPKEIIDKNVIVCTNLEPKKFGENTSNGMVLAATDDNGRPILLTLPEDIKLGSPIS